MLARATLFPLLFSDVAAASPQGQRGRPLSFPNSRLHPPPPARATRRWWWGLSAYKRIPMVENPGAYQLIDEDTGDKFIVLGGSDDGPDSPIPSQQVLSWKPHSLLHAAPKSDLAEEEVEEASAAGSVSGSFRGFGRLKAAHVKGLMKKRSFSSFSSRIAPRQNSDDSDTQHLGSFDSLAAKKPTSLALPGRRRETPTPSSLDESIPKKSTSDNVTSTLAAPVAATTLRGWGGAGSPGRSSATTAVAGRSKKQRRRTTADVGFFSRTSFQDLGCSEFMIQALKSLQYLLPSHIQAMAYGPILQGKSCIVADQSGSGKTLAYLAPVIQHLRQEELSGLAKPVPKCPRVLILVPTAELASQVLNNCRSMSKFGVPFRSMVVTGGFRHKTQLCNLQQELDVLIATPGRFLYLLQEGFILLTNLRSVILDEVDILFGDEDFEQVLQTLISLAPVTAQYLFVTATLPVVIYNKLVEIFPDSEVIIGPGMHRTSSGLEEVLVDCSGDVGEEKSPDTAFQNKKSALLQLVEESPVPKTIVFCNKIETCRKVENALKRFDRKGVHSRVLPFHAALDQEIRLSNMKDFINAKATDSVFLICTDRASRGMDFAGVGHVVLFDFPRDPSEYVRRVGRTARGAGGKGKAFVFVVGKQVSLAKRIMERNRKGHPLHDVPSASAYELSI